jgi:hypothetical protein
VLDVDLLMIELGRKLAGSLQGFERFFGEAVLVHGSPSQREFAPERGGSFAC